MHINTKYKLKNFAILNFYDKETCFAWNGQVLISFPSENCEFAREANIKIIQIPKEIKGLRNIDQRVYVLCKPSGIYKLTEKLERIPILC